MAWRLFCAKPLSEPMLTYSQLDLEEQTSVMFEWKYITFNSLKCILLQWRHKGRDGVLNHQPPHCLLNRLFRSTSKKTSKLRVTGLCAGNSPRTSPHRWPVMRKINDDYKCILRHEFWEDDHWTIIPFKMFSRKRTQSLFAFCNKLF